MPYGKGTYGTKVGRPPKKGVKKKSAPMSMKNKMAKLRNKKK